MRLAYKNNKRAWAYCPFHNDIKKPNLSITLEEPFYGHYKCWACGRSGTLTSRQLQKLGLRGMKRDKPSSIDWNALYLMYCKDRPGKKSPLAELWNVSIPTVWDFSCGWDGEAYTFPMYNAAEECTGIQRRFENGSKSMVQGSKLGLFIPTGLAYENTLFITEGVSDACAVHDLGFEVIGRTSCNTCEDIIIDFINFEPEINRVVLIPDNDRVGLEGCHNLEVSIDDKCYVAIGHFCYKGCKDIREYIAKVGKERVRNELRTYL